MVVFGGMLVLVCRSDAQEELPPEDPALEEPPREISAEDIRGRLALASIFLSEEMNSSRALTCYRAFSELMELRNLSTVFIAASAFADQPHPTLAPEDLDILWGLAVCSAAHAKFMPSMDTRVERFEEASAMYRAYVELEHREVYQRPEGRVDVATEQSGVLLDAADELRTTLLSPLFDRDDETDSDGSLDGPSYEDALAKATDHLANQRGQECHDAYSVLYYYPDGRGKGDPDVLWGVAACAEIVAGDIPDLRRRRAWWVTAIEWYRSYIGVERRAVQLVPGTGRVAVAALRITHIERQLAEAEQMATIADPGTAVVVAANDRRVPVERVPLSDEHVDATPPSTSQEPAPVDPLALMRCYARHGLLNVALVGSVGQRASTGRIRPPPAGTPCSVD